MTLIRRVAQRSSTECVVAVIAMLIEKPYEEVIEGLRRYPCPNATDLPYISTDGYTELSCIIKYLNDCGFTLEEHPVAEAATLEGDQRGMLMLSFETAKNVEVKTCGHALAVDAAGIVDPSRNGFDHIPLFSYCEKAGIDVSTFLASDGYHKPLTAENIASWGAGFLLLKRLERLQ